MVDKAIIVYVLIDDILETIKHQEDKRRTMSDSEVITTVLIAAMLFAGNIEKAKGILYQTGLIPDMLGKSRLCKRIHAISDLVRYPVQSW